MAISFNCSFCGESYSKMKDELVGKRVTCRNAACRKAFVVVAQAAVAAAKSTPAAAPKVPLDDAAAAAFLAEEPAKVEVQQVIVQVTCNHCECKFEVTRDMEGKNTPCPECRKLVRVPLVKKDTQVDWRKAESGKDHLLKRDEPPPPEGVTKSTTVSATSLVQAGAVPKVEYEPLPMGVKLRRAAILLVLLGVIGFGVMMLMKNRGETKTENNLVQAISEIEKNEEGKSRPDLQAAIYRAAGEHRARSAQKRTELDEAIKFLNIARSKLEKGADGIAERQAELVETAVAMCSLGGTAEEIDRDVRLPWDQVQKQIRQTLQRIGDEELRIAGIRRVALKLAEYNQGGRAVHIARQDIFPAEAMPEVIGQIGLELIRAGRKEAAKEMLKASLAMLDAPTAGANAPSLTALRIALGTPDQPFALGTVAIIQAPKGGGISEPYRLAYAEGFAFSGDLKKATEIATAPGVPAIRVRAMLAVATQALDENQKDQAVPLLEAAANLLAKEAKGGLSVWLRVRAIHLLGRAGKPEAGAALADAITDEGIRSWARMELLNGRLVGLGKEAATEAMLEDLGDTAKLKLGVAVGRERFARHQAAGGHGSTKGDGLPPLLKPFAQLGSMLGSQDRGLAP